MSQQGTPDRFAENDFIDNQTGRYDIRSHSLLQDITVSTQDRHLDYSLPSLERLGRGLEYRELFFL